MKEAMNDLMVYVPAVIWHGKNHAHEGGGGGYVLPEEALRMGARNIRVSSMNGVATPTNGQIADWPVFSQLSIWKKTLQFA